MIWVAIAVGGGLVAVIAALVVYAVLTRDKQALPRITEFDPGRIPFQLLPDHRLNPRIRDALREAADFWNRAVGAEWFLVSDVAEGGSLVPVGPYHGQETEHQKALAYVNLTLTKSGEGIAGASVWINTIRYDTHDLPMPVLRNALAHELGHVLGLAHDDFTESIMYGKARGEDATVTRADVIFLQEAYRERSN